MDSLEQETLGSLGGASAGLSETKPAFVGRERWVFTYGSGPDGKPILLNTRGPLYDYENWPEDWRPLDYRAASPKITETSGFSSPSSSKE